MEALATASASQLPADAPVVPLLRVVTANLMKEPDNEKFRKIKMDGVFPASPPGAREGSVPKKSAGRGRSRSPLRTDARRPGMARPSPPEPTPPPRRSFRRDRRRSRRGGW